MTCIGRLDQRGKRALAGPGFVAGCVVKGPGGEPLLAADSAALMTLETQLLEEKTRINRWCVLQCNACYCDYLESPCCVTAIMKRSCVSELF